MLILFIFYSVMLFSFMFLHFKILSRVYVYQLRTTNVYVLRVLLIYT